MKRLNQSVLGVVLTCVVATALPWNAAAGVPYPTAASVSQLVADINYVNQAGGTFTIYLQPNTTFTNGVSGIGGTKAVNLTIVGNGATIDGGHQSRLFTVNSGSSLNLNQMTLRNGYVYANHGGAIYNSGLLTLSNCTLSGNTSLDRSDYLSSLRGVGGAIYNSGGTVTVNNCILSGNLSTGANPMGGAIYNAAGSVTISNSTLTANSAVDTVLGIEVNPEYPQSGEGGAICNVSGMVTITHSSLTNNYAAFKGGAICNGYIYGSSGTTIVKDASNISGNILDDVQNSGALYLDGGSRIGILAGNSVIGVSPTLSIQPFVASRRVVLSWSTNYGGFALQSSTSVSSVNWTNCPSPAISGPYFVVTNPISPGAQFFRLIK